MLPSVLHQLATSRQLCTQMPRLNKPRRVRLVRQWKTVRASPRNPRRLDGRDSGALNLN